MATRFVKNSLRTETPRLKDLSITETVRDPSEGRQGHGHFGPRNRHSIDQGIKALVRKGLGDPEDAATGRLVREATRLYLALMRSLPSDGPGVRQLVASQARHVMLATHYANESAKEGFASERGLKLAEASRSHDLIAQRLSVTAYDRAVREAASKPKATKAVWQLLAEGTPDAGAPAVTSDGNATTTTESAPQANLAQPEGDRS